MRDEDVVDADRVLPRGPLHRVAARGRAVRARPPHARIGHLLETDPGGAGSPSTTGASRASRWRWSARASGASRSSASTSSCRAAASGASCSRAAGPTARRARAVILSSTNPPAMRRYGRTGLPIRPAVACAGIPDLRARAGRDGRRGRRRGRHRARRRHRPRVARRRPRARPRRCRGPRRAPAGPRGPRVRAVRAAANHPARRPRRGGRAAPAVGAVRDSAGRVRRSTSTSSRRGRTGRCPCAWTRGWR